MSWLRSSKNDKHASPAGRLPFARADELVVEEVDDELLIYDKTTNRAHSLNPVAARVWRACDGLTTMDALCTRLDLDPRILGQVLIELDGNSLLQGTAQTGHTRREMTIKAAKLGTAASVPFIYSVLGPVPMAAATPTPAQCLHYTSGSCGSVSSGGCGSICGCCCCCTGCATSNGGNGCSICYPASMCPSTPGSQCPSNGTGITGGSNGNCTTSTCSAPGSGCVPPCTGVVLLGNPGCSGAFPNPCPPGF